MGQLFMMGFDGTEVNPQIRSLIENYHLGAVLLSAKNLKCMQYWIPPSCHVVVMTDTHAFSCRGSNEIGLRTSDHCP